jgi:hypothetical protein
MEDDKMKTALKAAKVLGVFLFEILSLIAAWVAIHLTNKVLVDAGHPIWAVAFLFVGFYCVLLVSRLYNNWKKKKVEGFPTTLKLALIEEACFVVAGAVIIAIVFTGTKLYHINHTVFYWLTGAFVLAFAYLLIVGVVKITERGE